MNFVVVGVGISVVVVVVVEFPFTFQSKLPLLVRFSLFNALCYPNFSRPLLRMRLEDALKNVETGTLIFSLFSVCQNL